ncbi:hypothetical protein KKC47_03705 [Patescibacteria group bacterium]|nr:hypothetical protein [Patescibacteria group bacterium]
MFWKAPHVHPQPERQPLHPLPLLARRQAELELQLARQQVELQQSGGGARQSRHVSLARVAGEFCFTT